jgi:DNA-binding NarL/FixJ family response regulator
MTGHGRIWCPPGGILLIEELTHRELEVLEQVAVGARNREIAVTLNVSVKTVEFHLRNILSKLGVRSRTEAVVRACQLDLLALPSYSGR